jgi:hypothetical protein
VELSAGSGETAWALQNGTAIEFDAACVPLAIADPAVMLRFEREYGGVQDDSQAREYAGAHSKVLPAPSAGVAISAPIRIAMHADGNAGSR